MTAPAVDHAPVQDDPIPDEDLAAGLEAYVNRPLIEDPEPEGGAPEAKDPVAVTAASPDQTTPPPAPDGTTPEGETPPAPADPAAEADPFAALLKDAKPLTFRVDGAERTHDLILEVPGRGAVIPADKLDAFRNTVARAESNAEAVRTLLAEREGYERVGGLAKFHEQADQYAALNAVGLLLIDAIENPLSLVTVNEAGQVVPHADRIAILQDRMRVAKDRALYDSRSARSEAARTQEVTAQDRQARATAIPETIDAHFASFAPEDRAAAKAFFGKTPDAYLFTVTAETAAQYGQPIGTLMVRADLIRDYLTERATLRGTAQTDQQKRAAAEKENAARVTTRPAVPPKPKAAGQPRAADGTFTDKPRWTKDQMMERALAGKGNGPDDDD